MDEEPVNDIDAARLETEEMILPVERERLLVDDVPQRYVRVLHVARPALRDARLLITDCVTPVLELGTWNKECKELRATLLCSFSYQL